MAYALPLFPPGFRVTGADGLPSAGAVLRFFTAGSSSPLTVYSNAAGSSAIGTTVTCDADGYPSNSGSRVNVYTSAASIKITAEDADAVALWSHDNVTGVLDTSVFLTTPSTEITIATSTLSTTTTLTAADLVNKLITANPGGGSFVVTLPSVAGDAVGVPFYVTHIGSSGTVTIKGAGTDPVICNGIDTGRRAVLLMQKGDHAMIVSDGVSWYVMTVNVNAPRSFAVESQLTSPPGSPTAGQAYLINGAPSGGFTSTTPACAANDVVVWDGYGWHIFRPSTDCGWTVFDKATDVSYQYRASAWARLIDTAAAQADMEAETSTTTIVVPSLVKNSPGVSKAHVIFSGTGTPTIASSRNVTSITDNGTGDYTVNFTSSFADANVRVCGFVRDSTVNFPYMSGSLSSSPAAASCRIRTCNGANVAADCTYISVEFFGDFA